MPQFDQIWRLQNSSDHRILGAELICINKAALKPRAPQLY
ncbi:hypothetical protein EV13_0552 [Prochlorococcus sp. MIT 0702]|nr:hypothetical protein EV12_1754 [Prochlorococcus sp. MIT 0701]KGG30220.1 hypothetical protein EV13_0552 [Prochlorococcus sp. MIT 0702]KGG34961.1 hypothetical protein EV14_1005 [Prochlorococcus sp. MIT 0703]